MRHLQCLTQQITVQMQEKSTTSLHPNKILFSFFAFDILSLTKYKYLLFCWASMANKDPLPQNRSTSHLRGGMELLLVMLEKEIKNPTFYSFEVRHQPDAERPYPVNHELLSLIVSYHVPGENHAREEVREIVRPHPSPYRYRCGDYHRHGKPLKR